MSNSLNFNENVDPNSEWQLLSRARSVDKRQKNPKEVKSQCWKTKGVWKLQPSKALHTAFANWTKGISNEQIEDASALSLAKGSRFLIVPLRAMHGFGKKKNYEFLDTGFTPLMRGALEATTSEQSCFFQEENSGTDVFLTMFFTWKDFQKSTYTTSAVPKMTCNVVDNDKKFPHLNKNAFHEHHLPA